MLIMLRFFGITLPLWVLALIGVLTLAILFIGIRIFIKRQHLKKIIAIAMADPEPILVKSLFKTQYPGDKLFYCSATITKYDRAHNTALHQLSGLDDLWITRFATKKDKASFTYLLNFYVDKALFDCFLAALEHPTFALIFSRWLTATGKSRAFYEIGLACKGEYFNGTKAANWFKQDIDKLMEYAMAEKSGLRYMAIRTLLSCDDERSDRILYENFKDPFYKIREVTAARFGGAERQRVYNELYRLYIHDPVRPVRIAARERITKDFSDIFSINIDNLNNFERLHAVEHLDINSKADENLALEFLASERLEERFTAAVFLDKSGALKRLLQQVDIGDKPGLNRNLELLKLAVSVNVTTFLLEAERSNNPGTLLLAVELLSETGNRKYIDPIVKSIFQIPLNTMINREIFDKALYCISLKGERSTYALLTQQIKKYRTDTEIIETILHYISPFGGIFVKDILLSLLTDPDFPPSKELRDVFLRNPSGLFLEELFDIIHNYTKYPVPVRKEALRIIGGIDDPTLIQNQMENLFILDHDEAIELAGLLIMDAEEPFISIAKRLFQSVDASVREILTLVIPEKFKKIFLPDIIKQLEDSDPSIRIASVKTIIRLGSPAEIKMTFALLQDPYSEVRAETAKTLAESGNKEYKTILQKTLSDKNEIDAVKASAIKGLSYAQNTESVDILVEYLEKETPLEPLILRGLSQKRTNPELTGLIDHFKTGSPMLREKLILVFSLMKHKGEDQLMTLLTEDKGVLAAYIYEIFEQTGYISTLGNELRSRKKEARLSAISKLSLIRTKSAGRLLLLSVRDVSKEIRIKAVGALQDLTKSEGEEILKDLSENDPDKLVRQTAHRSLVNMRAQNKA